MFGTEYVVMGIGILMVVGLISWFVWFFQPVLSIDSKTIRERAPTMFVIKSLFTALGIFLGSIILCGISGFGMGWIFNSQKIAVSFISMSPLVGIGSAVHYFKNAELKRKASRETAQAGKE